MNIKTKGGNLLFYDKAGVFGSSQTLGILIHNGRVYHKTNVFPARFGFRLGEFCFTRQRFIFKKKITKKGKRR